jgi:trans-aconitate 2-methyltransferase
MLIEAVRLISAGGHDLDATLDALVEQARRLFDVPDVAINLRDPDTGQYLRRRTSVLLDPTSPHAVAGTPIMLSVAAQEALATGRAVLVEDFRRDARVNARSRAALPTVTGMIAVPLVDEGAPIGLMLVRWTDQRRMEPSDVELTEALGQHAAVAIRSARLVADLRRSSRRYRLVAEAARAMVWEWDPGSGALAWEGAGPAAYGYPEATADNVDWWNERVHPADRDRFRRTALDALASGAEGYEVGYRFRQADGAYASCRSVGWIARAGGAAPPRVLGVMMDVTALRAAEEERDRLADALVRAAERERVAMDLHDGAAQHLYGATLGLAAAELTAGADPARAIGQAQAIVVQASAALRRYMEGLLAPMDDATLEETIAGVVEELAEMAGAEITTDVDPAAATGLPTAAAEHLGYIVREAVSNALRHGRARSVAVDVGGSRGRTVLTVRDDGVGFHPPRPRPGRGLANMRRRAALLGGRLTIMSRPGEGTIVRLAVPRSTGAPRAARLAGHRGMTEARDEGGGVERGAPVGGRMMGEVRPRDWNAPSYDRVANAHVGWGRRVLDWLDLEGDERVLDAGCGTGRVTELLLERLPRGRVLALDASPSMLQEAGRRLAHARERVDLLCADLTRPLPVEGALDAILSTATFHWVADHDALFRNLAAALRPGGQLVAQCGGAGNIATVIAALPPAEDGWPGPWTFAGPEETRRRLEGAGFEDVHVWLQEEPTPLEPGEPLESFLATVILGAHLDRLPVGEREGYVKGVAARLPRAEIDYVRLNMVARRGLSAAKDPT